MAAVRVKIPKKMSDPLADLTQAKTPGQAIDALLQLGKALQEVGTGGMKVGYDPQGETPVEVTFDGDPAELPSRKNKRPRKPAKRRAPGRTARKPKP